MKLNSLQFPWLPGPLESSHQAYSCSVHQLLLLLRPFAWCGHHLWPHLSPAVVSDRCFCVGLWSVGPLHPVPGVQTGDENGTRWSPMGVPDLGRGGSGQAFWRRWQLGWAWGNRVGLVKTEYELLWSTCREMWWAEPHLMVWYSAKSNLPTVPNPGWQKNHYQ